MHKWSKAFAKGHLNMCRAGEDRVSSFTKQDNLPNGRQMVANVSANVSANFIVNSQNPMYLGTQHSSGWTFPDSILCPSSRYSP